MENVSLGSCLCEQVKFEIIGEFKSFYLCHCKFCQKDTGSAHAAILFSSTAKLNWLCGEEKVKTYNLPSTRHVKSFCTECGSALANIQNSGKLLAVPAGSLDTPVSLIPNAHIFMNSKGNWDNELETITKFDSFPS